MKKIIPLSLIAIASLYASEVQLAPISVESTVITEVSQNAQVSADLAQALSTSVPSIDMNRRSGIANDVYIRGQKRDNISVDVDGTKVQGACVNRMDPPISHIITSQIDEIEVIEGPYDVENMGTLSGGIRIKTKKPTKDLHGSVDFGFGSFNYTKIGATISGGNDTVRVLVSGSSESSDQYKDGNGDTIAEQIDKYAVANPAAAGMKFKPAHKEMPAYKKKSIMAKAFVNVTDNQELRLSVTKNKSDDVLYGNSKMDALYDDSNIYAVEYNIKNVSDIYKNINLKYYYSDVDHPMATTYRMSSNVAAQDNTNHLKTTMQGLKLKNDFDINSFKLLVGFDGSKRTWDGNYYNTTTGAALAAGNSKSLDDALTKNGAIFAKLDKKYGSFGFSLGARYDSTKITHATLQSNDYTSFGANLMTSYNLDKENKVFLGFGQASRVPDARELYFRSSNGAWSGTANLNQTTNREIDLGYETDNSAFKLKIKGFYSMLSDYIYYQKQANGVAITTNNFKNLDATVYGTELTTSYYATDDVTVDLGASYKVGKKDKALTGQTDTDLADMAPLRGNVALNYEYMKGSIATAEVQASDKWSKIDSDNGEQELKAWTILNLKVKHAVNKNFNFTLGVNNLLDETYAMNNTYADLILVTAGGTSDIMLMNEPGRYVYTNLNFKF
ncbi:TonB-dependent receptor [Sulfurimonas gotlandica GD1]|jgi:iron complex outermembrane receptor protein|uniref:TonB-dependent receptor n=1 Tax=Sulfurimonas gotlandica (strain DSM 19862 / JCM 16533 / GD1) TaxID=929558 RepID=B6BM30_SULGG|nr:TonB-dependent receptor [Sulfurimonas gotlandica]EDZ61831.1 TonB-dependent receptor [Sulfurimonas gotlandica GD1]EHP29394.1 TonB-dependent receptor [Sulfurimonas gotlandica GD1]